ncbi:MAG: GNAT family N-acetyltransferase [Oculatellaceae cyanobacterium Prado106]|jgi:RimJ/RimL family protein N-acetyltransferase|nr:GNAT family N-acetyltransferase [Oculatellaceae cyanobacterium Prado106]
MLPELLPQRTERLTLRRFIDQDLERFLAYRQDPQVARFQGWSMLSQDEAQSFIHEMQTATLGVPGEWCQIAIAHSQSNLLLGDTGMQIDKEQPTVVEIGFTLSRDAQGQGYAHEAMQSLITALFNLDIHKIIGITDQRNEPSVRLLSRLGMSLVRSHPVKFKGEWCIEQTFELTKEAWRSL